ncbi:EAL domain-containing protein [Terasakiella sp. A23]|uniref:putative bifunctional diguanylate cyclase/phosphodiesterase n=1 Tax=Terasakiella sp. FCG-A23 TaxID=3080561 RepID=UPI002955961A|nr:EAL domain-containing protein [Terasakiella sp. A23]MDV7338325.1 EAL domain-containing protein [Terasakiella sp. A23]
MVTPLHFDPDMILAGLDRGEFFLLYQPRVDLFREQVVSVEALVRWKHPKYGILSPDRFIPACERNGTIHPLGNWILRTAVSQAAQWQRDGLDLQVSINLSVEHITFDLPDKVQHLLKDNALAPDKIELEITEGILLSEEARTILNQFDNLNIPLSIDDFGTGHSSLSYLRQFNARTLKIDKSFLDDTPGDLDACLLLRSIIDLGHSLGMHVVCEGVETEAQFDIVQMMEADQVQGYYFSKPVAAGDIPSRLSL